MQCFSVMVSLTAKKLANFSNIKIPTKDNRRLHGEMPNLFKRLGRPLKTRARALTIIIRFLTRVVSVAWEFWSRVVAILGPVQDKYIQGTALCDSHAVKEDCHLNL
jgi:hypothetical protein